MDKRWLNTLFPAAAIAVIAVILLGIQMFGKKSEANDRDSSLDQELMASQQQEIRQINDHFQGTATPVILAIAVDQSASMNQSRLTALGFDDLTPLLKQISQRSGGGVFAVSAICDRSNRPLTRTTWQGLPVPPGLEPIGTIPEPPDLSKGNPFKNRERLDEYQATIKEIKSSVEANQGALSNYGRVAAATVQQNQERITTLQPDIEAILHQPRDCQSTDIQNAIARVQTVFEETTTWPQQPLKIAVFITDGLDSFSDAPAAIEADQLIVVNGAVGMGIFENVPHERFESPQAAIRELTQRLSP